MTLDLGTRFCPVEVHTTRTVYWDENLFYPLKHRYDVTNRTLEGISNPPQGPTPILREHPEGGAPPTLEHPGLHLEAHAGDGAAPSLTHPGLNPDGLEQGVGAEPGAGIAQAPVLVGQSREVAPESEISGSQVTFGPAGAEDYAPPIF